MYCSWDMCVCVRVCVYLYRKCLNCLCVFIASWCYCMNHRFAYTKRCMLEGSRWPPILVSATRNDCHNVVLPTSKTAYELYVAADINVSRSVETTTAKSNFNDIMQFRDIFLPILKINNHSMSQGEKFNETRKRACTHALVVCTSGTNFFFTSSWFVL